ncbi:hypothetical protein [Sodalis-like endosymbiont of Proechinophthirus fluctus]|uniref:hypothetical protein n=1 Tax=Sodalis-like endosymbiont of Proechinophthirus fluctus TaxID=1462730 RepID=UPI000A8DBD51|nr:hypothetical protein [Sodalis-like endosymbiont of Proechinophthirus fluctus]
MLEQHLGSFANLKQSINSGAGIQLTGTLVADDEAPANTSVTIAGLTIQHCRIKRGVDVHQCRWRVSMWFIS